MEKGLGYRGDAGLLQGTLLAALDAFCATHKHLLVGFSDMMDQTEREIRRIIEFLEIAPEEEKIASALGSVEPGARAKVEVEGQEARRAAKRLRPKRLLQALRKTIGSRG